jgi:hypothetical protein
LLLADFFKRGIPIFQIIVQPSIIISASANLLLAIIALSKIFNASTLLSKSSIYFWKVFIFIPDFLSTSDMGFLSKSSAFEYSVQILALREPYLALPITLQAPSQS